MNGSPASTRVTRRAIGRRVVAALLLGLAVSGCTGSDDPAGSATHPVSTPGAVTGPLCDRLPTGTDPGGPETLKSEPADQALQWIPVLTIFEAGTRATGLDADLGDMDGVTILAPTDEAFTNAFSEDTLDEFLISRRRELRALLRAHMIDGEFSLEQMIDAGRVTTLAGDSIDITPRENGMARFDDQAETVCADYLVANARVHVIDGVLKLPAPTGGP
jgi:uncharacterized surface protein with fasciclin (FAS1) repeats